MRRKNRSPKLEQEEKRGREAIGQERYKKNGRGHKGKRLQIVEAREDPEGNVLIDPSNHPGRFADIATSLDHHVSHPVLSLSCCWGHHSSGIAQSVGAEARTSRIACYQVLGSFAGALQ